MPEGWRRLAQEIGNIFATPEWCDVWWAHLGRGERWIVEERSPRGELIALCPLYVVRRGLVRVVRFLGEGPADLLGPLARPRHMDAAVAGLDRALSARSDWDVFVAQDLPSDRDWPVVLGGLRIRDDSSPVLVFREPTWDEFLQARSRNFRYSIRRAYRRLQREGSIRFRLSDEESLGADLEEFFRLHGARWSGKGSFRDRRLRDFHRAFTEVALERGWLRMWVLECDSRPAAIWYGFRFADAEYYYQMGRDPALEELSVGSVLLTHSIEQALRDGMSEYRFLRGAESYKSRWANQERRIETVARSSGPLGRMSVAAARFAHRDHRI